MFCNLLLVNAADSTANTLYSYYTFHQSNVVYTTFGYRITKLDMEKNQTIREKLGVQYIVKEIKQYQQKWLPHVQRMDTNRIRK